MRYVWPTLLIVLLTSACSSGSTKKATPSAAPSPTAVAGGATTPGATASPTAAIGTAVVSGTVVPSAAPGIDPAIVEALSATIHHQIEALNAGKLDELYGLYSKCAKNTVTKDQLAFGKSATGRLTLLSISVVRADAQTALVGIETRSQIFVGNQNHFRSQSSFVLEDGNWKFDAQNPASCGR